MSTNSPVRREEGLTPDAAQLAGTIAAALISSSGGRNSSGGESAGNSKGGPRLPASRAPLPSPPLPHVPSTLASTPPLGVPPHTAKPTRAGLFREAIEPDAKHLQQQQQQQQQVAGHAAAAERDAAMQQLYQEVLGLGRAASDNRDQEQHGLRPGHQVLNEPGATFSSPSGRCG